MENNYNNTNFEANAEEVIRILSQKISELTTENAVLQSIIQNKSKRE